MLLNQNRPPTAYQHRPRQHLSHNQLAHSNPAFLDASARYAAASTTNPFAHDAGAIDLDFDDINYQSLSSSPTSTQSLPSQFSGIGSSPLSTFDSIPTPTAGAPRGTLVDPLFYPSPQSDPATLAESTLPLFGTTDLMQTDTWYPTTNGPLTPRSVGRFSHHRESSLSSLGSNGPASPYSHNTSNPQIALTDAVGSDGFHGLPGGEDFPNYQLAKLPTGAITHDNFYANYPTYASADHAATTAYPQLATAPKRRAGQGLFPPSEHPIGSGRSQPASVASSVVSDSPATPAGDLEEDRRHKNALSGAPKLNRTMTDVFSDELYNPEFTIAGSSGSSNEMPISPSNGLFAQRLNAANQHLSAVHSPALVTPRGRSPFRNNSPMAPVPLHDFSSTVGSSQVRFGSAQQMREQKAVQDAHAVQQQMAARTTDTSTPQTISPKDAMLEFHDENEGNASFVLFPAQGTNGFDVNAMSKPTTTSSQPAFDTLAMDTSFANYAAPHPQLPPGLHIPQQYPFISQARQQSSVPSLSNGSRVGSADAGAAESSHNGNSPQRPVATSADGGTYTCTYHGCTLRFETPALLQKHKREGHRQAHGLNGTRRPDSAGAGMTSSLLNTQAGPHRCDRINPSTGKPCNTVFSRPYDLTRHEDTIHNARKQKVRCDLCTDEKTFSRADALTRHYRVCHPEVEFPGKQRRRGGHSG